MCHLQCTHSFSRPFLLPTPLEVSVSGSELGWPGTAVRGKWPQGIAQRATQQVCVPGCVCECSEFWLGQRDGSTCWCRFMQRRALPSCNRTWPEIYTGVLSSKWLHVDENGISLDGAHLCTAYLNYHMLSLCSFLSLSSEVLPMTFPKCKPKRLTWCSNPFIK